MTNKDCKSFMKKWFKKRDFMIDKNECIFRFGNFTLIAAMFKDRFYDQYWLQAEIVVEELHTDEERATWHKWSDLSTVGRTRYGERNQFFRYLEHDEEDLEKYLQDIFGTYFKPFFDEGIERIVKIVKDPNNYGYGKDHWWHVHPKAKEYVAKLESQ